MPDGWPQAGRRALNVTAIGQWWSAVDALNDGPPLVPNAPKAPQLAVIASSINICQKQKTVREHSIRSWLPWPTTALCAFEVRLCGGDFALPRPESAGLVCSKTCAPKRSASSRAVRLDMPSDGGLSLVAAGTIVIRDGQASRSRGLPRWPRLLRKATPRARCVNLLASFVAQPPRACWMASAQPPIGVTRRSCKRCLPTRSSRRRTCLRG